MSDQTAYNSPHRKKLLTVFMMGLLFPFAESLLYSIGFPHSEYVFETVRPLWLAVTAGSASGLFFTQPNRLQKISASQWLLAAAMVWIVVRVIADRYVFYENDPQHIWVRAFSAWFLFYPVGSLLDREEMKKAVHWIAAVWVGTMVFLGIVGIVSVCNGVLVYTPNNATRIGMENNRLILAYYCVTSAQNAVLACNLALFVMFTTGHKWLRVLCGAAIALLFVALGLIDGTNGMLTLAVLLGMAAFVLVTNRLSPRTVRGFAAGIAAALAVLLVCYNANTKVLNCFEVGLGREVYVDQLLGRNQPAPQEIPLPSELPPAQVEETQQIQRDPTHLKIDASLHGRTQIWKSALESLLSNEKNSLLIGCTPYGFDELIQTPELPYRVPTSHNIYLQVVLEWGLPGLVIMAAFLFLFVKSALRLLFGEGVPLWERFVPCMAIAGLFSELADCFADLNTDTVSLYLLFLFLGLTMGLDFRERNMNG